MLLLSLALAAGQATPLNDWAVFRDDAQTCVASRFFNGPDGPFRVRVGTGIGGKTPDFVGVEFPADWASPPPTSIPLGKSGPARPVLGADGQENGTLVVGGPAGRSWSADIRFNMDQYRGARSVNAWVSRDAFDTLGAATTARINRPGGQAIDMAIGPVPVAALRACRLHILTEWGVDPARLVELPDAAAGWFTDADYPAAARRQGAAGRTVAMLAIGEDGVIKSCRVVMSTGSSELDDATCAAVLLRGSFAPAPGKGERLAIIRTFWRLQM